MLPFDQRELKTKPVTALNCFDLRIDLKVNKHVTVWSCIWGSPGEHKFQSCLQIMHSNVRRVLSFFGSPQYWALNLGITSCLSIGVFKTKRRPILKDFGLDLSFSEERQSKGCE